jgi:short subunit dehydrogenase-like uncharacterized protein
MIAGLAGEFVLLLPTLLFLLLEKRDGEARGLVDEQVDQVRLGYDPNQRERPRTGVTGIASTTIIATATTINTTHDRNEALPLAHHKLCAAIGYERRTRRVERNEEEGCKAYRRPGRVCRRS